MAGSTIVVRSSLNQWSFEDWQMLPKHSKSDSLRSHCLSQDRRDQKRCSQTEDFPCRPRSSRMCFVWLAPWCAALPADARRRTWRPAADGWERAGSWSVRAAPFLCDPLALLRSASGCKKPKPFRRSRQRRRPWLKPWARKTRASLSWQETSC